MAATVSIDRPVSRRRSAKPASVSASALAKRLDCSRTYIGKLEEGVTGHGGLAGFETMIEKAHKRRLQ